MFPGKKNIRQEQLLLMELINETEQTCIHRLKNRKSEKDTETLF